MNLLVTKPVNVIDHKATGKAMRETREQCGISLRELSRLMNFSAPYISDLELGRRQWTEKKARQYMGALKSATKPQQEDAR